MSKKNKIIVGVLCVILVILVVVMCGMKLSESKGYKITINNNTNKTIESLELRYKSGDTILNIFQIQPQESWKHNIITDSIQGENSIILRYKDKKGDYYEECIVGYLEKGYTGQADVLINKIDDNGKLMIKVK